MPPNRPKKPTQVRSKKPSKPSKNQPKQTKPITLFTGPNCPWCAKTKAFLKRYGMRFKSIDLSTNKQALADCKRAGCSGIPVVLIGKEWICGHNEEKIKRALGIR